MKGETFQVFAMKPCENETALPSGILSSKFLAISLLHARYGAQAQESWPGQSAGHCTRLPDNHSCPKASHRFESMAKTMPFARSSCSPTVFLEVARTWATTRVTHTCRSDPGLSRYHPSTPTTSATNLAKQPGSSLPAASAHLRRAAG